MPLSEIKLKLHFCVTNDATRNCHVDDTSVMKFAVWIRNTNALLSVDANSIVISTDVKNLVTVAIVRNVGRQVLKN